MKKELKLFIVMILNNFFPGVKLLEVENQLYIDGDVIMDKGI